jgi:hypothetical protein
MRYICNCGNISKICFSSFQNGHRCKRCSGCEKYTIEFVKQYFKDHGCKLLEDEYINNSTLMRYICECGDENKITFSKFLMGRRCRECAKEKREQTMLKKYGVPYFPHCGYSKESQTLFDAIYEKLNKKQKKKTYYATLNKEFGVNYKGKRFKYDYVNSESKKVIEYNGSVWHPKSSLLDNATGWHVINKTKTAKEARDYEKIKYECLEQRDYIFLTIWDYDMKKDFNLTVQKCLDFLSAYHIF